MSRPVRYGIGEPWCDDDGVQVRVERYPADGLRIVQTTGVALYRDHGSRDKTLLAAIRDGARTLRLIAKGK